MKLPMDVKNDAIVFRVLHVTNEQNDLKLTGLASEPL